MATDRFLIGYADNQTGLQTNVKPFILPDNAYSQLFNCYVFRGRTRKRFGSIWMGTSQLDTRLRYLLPVTVGNSGTVPGSIFGIGQMFSIGTDVFTVNATGNPATLLSTNPAITFTYDTSNGAYVVTGATSSSQIFFYPATPAMGLPQYYVPVDNNSSNFAFDTQFSYVFDTVANTWGALTTGASIWTGTDANFFWSTNYQGVTPNINYLFTTNYFPADGIRYFDGTTWNQPVLNFSKGSVINTTDGSGNASGTVSGGSGFIGQVFTIQSGENITYFLVTATSGALTVGGSSVGTGTFDTTTGAYTFTGAYANKSIYFTGNNQIYTSLLIIQFQTRLLLFNTIEERNGSTVKFFNRLRYSSLGDATNPLAFMRDIAGGGGSIDAPVQQAIITAQFIKNRLIVYFENTTMELAFTGNQINPFVWQTINIELGAQSTFSEIPFDKEVFGIDDIGIHACNGANVERIDENIPTYAFDFSSVDEGRARIYGIRDYYNELVYWSYPNAIRNDSFYFPNRLLVYNYINNAFSTFDDSITCLGYFPYQEQTPGSTWGNTYTAWQDLTILWNSSSDATTTPARQSVIAGNQQGFISVLLQDLNSNAAVLQVTDVNVSTNTITCINHNLEFNDFVMLSNMNGITFSNGADTTIFRVANDPYISNTPNSFIIANPVISMSGTYTGGGNIARVSEIELTTKQFNFYTAQDRNCYISRVDFLVDKTSIGQVTVDFLLSSSQNSVLSGSLSNGALPGGSILETSPYALVPFEQVQDRLWHPVYFYAEGQCVQFDIFMSPAQMFNYNVDDSGTIQYTALQDFQLHAMVIYAQPTTSRMQ